MEPTFSEERILDVLSKMAAHQQLTFGAACCERMLPNYETFVREVAWRSRRPGRATRRPVASTTRVQPDRGQVVVVASCPYPFRGPRS